MSGFVRTADQNFCHLLLKFIDIDSWQCETGTSAGELRAEPRAIRLVNHPFRLDSQRLLSYLTSMRVLTLAVTPANSTAFWSTIYFYTASATAGNLSYDCARGRHCTVSVAASPQKALADCGAALSLCLNHGRLLSALSPPWRKTFGD